MFERTFPGAIVNITALLVLVFLCHGIEITVEIQAWLVRDFQKLFFTLLLQANLKIISSTSVTPVYIS